MEKDIIEIRRQVFHLILGLVIVSLYLIGALTQGTLLIIFFIGLITALLSKKYKIPVIYWFLKKFEREKDLKENPGKGVLTFIGGSLLALVFFEENIALAAIMVLAVGDSVSHIVGKHFGKRKYWINSPKYLEGTVAGIFFASIAASFFVGSKLAFMGSAAAMILESIELKIGKTIIDDNLTVPLVAGLVMHLLQIL